MTQKQYRHNLLELKRVIDTYTIPDLRNMIYGIPVSSSGACCYPAIQLLISLMELLGRLFSGATKYKAFHYTLRKMGERYDNDQLAHNLYHQFRHGIAHNSLAKGTVAIKKDGDRRWHLYQNKIIDVRIMFEDFLTIYESLFDDEELLDPGQDTFEYRKNNFKKLLNDLRYTLLTDNGSDFFQQKAQRIFSPGAQPPLVS